MIGWNERKGDDMFEMAENYEKETAKVSNKLHRIISSSDPMINSTRRIWKKRALWMWRLLGIWVFETCFETHSLAIGDWRLVAIGGAYPFSITLCLFSLFEAHVVGLFHRVDSSLDDLNPWSIWAEVDSVRTAFGGTRPNDSGCIVCCRDKLLSS